MGTLAAHPRADSFAGMEVRGDTLTDKENAGAALLDACKEVKTPSRSRWEVTGASPCRCPLMPSARIHPATERPDDPSSHLSADPRGNLTRIDNALAQMPQRLESVKASLITSTNSRPPQRKKSADPSPYEDELREKSARLTELDTLLNIDSKAPGQQETIVAKSTRPPSWRASPSHAARAADKKTKTREEVR